MIDRRLFAANVWLTEASLGAFDVRASLIQGTHRTLIWDTLAHPRHMQAFLPILATPDLSIVYSHADWDHVWGTTGLPYTTADIIGHVHCSKRFATDVPQKLHEKQTSEPGRWDDITLIPPTVTFVDEFVVDLGNISVTLAHLPGHTLDSIVAFLPTHGILLMADAVETPFPVVKDKNLLSLWIEGLRHWEQHPEVQTVIPAHGTIGGREIIRQNIAYLQCLAERRPIPLPDDLTEFYQVTHQMNLQICQD